MRYKQSCFGRDFYILFSRFSDQVVFEYEEMVAVVVGAVWKVHGFYCSPHSGGSWSLKDKSKISNLYDIVTLTLVYRWYRHLVNNHMLYEGLKLRNLTFTNQVHRSPLLYEFISM